MEYSDYQKRFFDWVKTGDGHGQGKALAGSGKTTTLLASFPRMKGMVAAVAFNKAIAEQLKRLVPPHVSATTLHSFGLRSLKGRPKIDGYKTDALLRAQFDTESRKDFAAFKKISFPVQKLVSLMKAEGIYGKPEIGEVSEIADYYGIDCGAKRIEVLNWALEIFEQSRKITTVIDFDDMIYLPVYLRMGCQQYDWVTVDEYQDMNKSQNDLLRLMLSKSGDDDFDNLLTGGGMAGRMLVIGDPHQAIYGFRGAMADIMDDYVKTMSAKVLPLNICYRCDRAIVTEAQKFVPEIETRDGAGEGLVEEIKRDPYRELVGAADFVLCRMVAPLMSECLWMIRNNRRAFIRGRDIGRQLGSILSRLDEPLGDALLAYRGLEYTRLSRVPNSDELISALNDRCDTIQVLIEAHGTKPLIARAIDELFKDVTDENAIMFSTIHKVKGLEASRVFVLPHKPRKAEQEWQKKQEQNLKYVAATRAKHELRYVYDR